VLYLDGTDRGRGWGQLDLAHPHEFAPPSPARAFLRGFLAATSPSTSALVAFGYVAPVTLGGLIGARLRGTQVFTQSDSSLRQDQGRSRARRWVKRQALHLLFSGTSRVWTVGEDNAAYWSAYGFGNQGRVSFESPVPTGPGTKRRALDLRRSVAPDPDSQVILFVGRISPEKRVGDLVKAVRLLSDEGQNCVLVVVGAPHDGLPSACTAVESGTLVHYVGPVRHTDLAAYYSMADVLVLPSEREAYGLVVSEALQFGLPVVATDHVPSARELCDRGWNIVPVARPDLMAVAIHRVLAEGRRWPRRDSRDVAPFYFAELARAAPRGEPPRRGLRAHAARIRARTFRWWPGWRDRIGDSPERSVDPAQCDATDDTTTMSRLPRGGKGIA